MLGNIPLHPLIVHFPVALFIVGVVAQLLTIWRQSDFLSRMAFYLILLGELSGIVAYLTGDDAEEFAERQWGNVHQMVEIHQAFATITLIVFGAFIGLRVIKAFVKIPYFKTMSIALALIGAVMISLTGHYGGRIVYQIPGDTQHVSHPTGDHNNH